MTAQKGVSNSQSPASTRFSKVGAFRRASVLTSCSGKKRAIICVVNDTAMTRQARLGKVLLQGWSYLPARRRRRRRCGAEERHGCESADGSIRSVRLLRGVLPQPMACRKHLQTRGRSRFSGACHPGAARRSLPRGQPCRSSAAASPLTPPERAAMPERVPGPGSYCPRTRLFLWLMWGVKDSASIEAEQAKGGYCLNWARARQQPP